MYNLYNTWYHDVLEDAIIVHYIWRCPELDDLLVCATINGYEVLLLYRDPRQNIICLLAEKITVDRGIH